MAAWRATKGLYRGTRRPFWAPVQLTGTPQNPKEDLSKRISSALQESVGKEFKDQTKDAIKSFLDLLRH